MLSIIKVIQILVFRSQMKIDKILKQFTIKRSFPSIPSILVYFSFSDTNNMYLILAEFEEIMPVHMYMFENTEKGNKQVKHTKKKIVRSKYDNF